MVSRIPRLINATPKDPSVPTLDRELRPEHIGQPLAQTRVSEEIDRDAGVKRADRTRREALVGTALTEGKHNDRIIAIRATQLGRQVPEILP
jgi:hypothetical protein